MSVLRPDAVEAAEEWARLVRANRDQVDRVREAPDGADFYRPVSARFRADPARQGDPSLDVLLDLARPGETWLDIGSGAGRYALPLAAHGVHVVAIDPSPSMLAGLREGMAEHGIAGIDIVEGRWPLPGYSADAALIAHVGYDIELITPFLDAMDDAVTAGAGQAGQCVALMADAAPSSACDPLWPAIHRESRAALPALPEFLVLLTARGSRFEVRRVERAAPAFATEEEAVALARRQLWLAEGTELDTRLRGLVHDHLVPADDGFVFPGTRATVGVVRWSPAQGRM